MSDFLIRGIPPKVHREIQHMADDENLSVNQFLVRGIMEMVKKMGEQKAEKEKREEVFRRLEEIREKLQRKYGSFDDSTKLIREDRDNR